MGKGDGGVNLDLKPLWRRPVGWRRPAAAAVPRRVVGELTTRESRAAESRATESNRPAPTRNCIVSNPLRPAKSLQPIRPDPNKPHLNTRLKRPISTRPISRPSPYGSPRSSTSSALALHARRTCLTERRHRR